jgi:hypothetical protein
MEINLLEHEDIYTDGCRLASLLSIRRGKYDFSVPYFCIQSAIFAIMINM